MLYLLDSYTLVYYLRGRPEGTQKLLETPREDFSTSSLYIRELYYGAAKSERQIERKAAVDQLQSTLISLSLSNKEMESLGRFRACLEKQGIKLSQADLMIAVTALDHTLIAVTGNVKHFRRSQGLKLENWIKR